MCRYTGIDIGQNMSNGSAKIGLGIVTYLTLTSGSKPNSYAIISGL